jgi:tripartite-type tricarboxylate transporter receptor subunit TctC
MSAPDGQPGRTQGETVDRRTFLIGAAAGVGAAIDTGLHGPAQAAATTMKFVYPYAPGSGGDVLVRLLADDLQKKLGFSAIVENKPGADGRIGVREVKQAEADGMTLLFTPFGTMVLFPSAFKDLPYDAFEDFTPVTQVVTYDFGLAAGPMTKARTLAELVTWLKANPDKGNVGVPGLGALPHLLPLKFATEAGVRIKAIAYKGTAPALTDVMAGQIPLVCAPLGDLVAQAKAGTVSLLASSGRTRNAMVQDVPTFVEQGFQIEGSGWYGIFAPAKTPAPQIEKLNRALVEAIHGDAFGARARSLWLLPTGTTPAELGAIQKDDFARWAPVIKAAGLVE